ncbi:MAG: Coenzyme F420 hydrogenase/dehydrogenase, beta subunit C-terminal domain [Phenylobacterium sp.]|uniref:Coenzyme F420 hydrogenase/dehydrogenase, beta subunit C-terminal domain n=1 Tax=Phenylobacterium sp. TaxID=1871053 RepID=UPI001A40A3DF|nr:Coenzyme F420 hydrogenase/dehydrogenase, beta subunit C-terminal domain [Phenylobacterium sp.]MBL8770968.1 Coenzyme F420 hydrogenase/dehydrogenase, beta subunit C-terminal domain [Phenylobacterium sp.]
MPDVLDTSPTVSRVLKGELCSGCGLCAAVSDGAIEMQSTPPGYNRPVVRAPVSSAAEALIAQSCPGAVVASWPGEAHPYWGPLRRTATGAAGDEHTRFEGSSGGAISGLLVHALETGVVDRVLHIAPDPRDPTRNATVVSRSAAEIIARAGSRYTASSPLAEISAALAEGGRMAVVCKPCDASALRRLAARDERVGRHVPLIVSFFCGGIPSHAGVGRILAAMGVEPAAVTDFRFRGRGWPGDCVATTPAGEARMSYAQSWGGHLSREVQFRCKICPDAVGGVADIACADAWYGDDDGYPSFDEEEGRSLIIARTEAGAALLDAAVAAGAVSVDALDPGEIEKMQPSQARRKRLILARVAALPLTLQPRPRMSGLKVLAAARLAPPMEALRNLVGTVRRTLQGRRSRL